MDYTRLQQLYSAKGRISSIPPHILFKVIIFIPSHMTFQRFFARLTVPVAKDLFAQLIREPATLDSITFQEVFIDGTKREANANRYTFVWRKAVGNQIDDLSTRNNSPYWAPETVIPKRTRMQLSCAWKKNHIRTGKLKPAYNVQVATHSEYILGVGVYPSPTDTVTLIPFIQKLEGLHQQPFSYIVAEAGYDSEENLDWLTTHTYIYAKELKQNGRKMPFCYSPCFTLNSFSRPLFHLLYPLAGIWEPYTSR